jgi:rhodanese-related sulfurtransferase
MRRIMLLTLAVLTACFSFTALWADEGSGMTKEELRARLGNPDVVVIDARVPGAWKMSRDKIKGALRENPMEARSWIGKYPRDKTYVFYCN